MSIIKGVRINDISDGMHIAALAEFEFCPLSQRVIARVTPEGEFLGGCVLDDYTGQTGSIRIHVGLTGHCFTRDFLYIGFSYVFDQLLAKKLFAFVPRSRLDVFSLALKFGFKAEAGIADYFPSDDMI